MKFLLAQNHMGLEISKRYFSYSVHPIWAKLYVKYGSHRGIYSYRYFGDLPKFKNFVALWNFNMGVNGKILKCAISWKRLIVERNGRKFGTRGTIVDIQRVLFMADSLSLVWGHSVHFTKISNFCNFKNSARLPIFILFHLNFMQGILIMQQYRLLLFDDLPQITKKYDILIFF